MAPQHVSQNDAQRPALAINLPRPKPTFVTNLEFVKIIKLFIVIQFHFFHRQTDHDARHGPSNGVQLEAKGDLLR